MRSSNYNLFYSAAQVVFALLILLLGLFVIGLEYAPKARFAIAEFLLKSTSHLSLIGFSILGFGILLSIGFYAMHAKRSYHFAMGEVDPALIQQSVQTYWDTTFNSHRAKTAVQIHSSDQIEVVIEMPQFTPEEHQGVLNRAEAELSTLFKNQLGYQGRFLLTVLAKP
ncbi:MAG: hypothetical protein JSS61_01340 [Verrucomicrobia bacterium]|nr:hypothetical protein [Verrucomicrobiota bacterium]